MSSHGCYSRSQPSYRSRHTCALLHPTQHRNRCSHRVHHRRPPHTCPLPTEMCRCTGLWPCMYRHSGTQGHRRLWRGWEEESVTCNKHPLLLLSVLHMFGTQSPHTLLNSLPPRFPYVLYTAPLPSLRCKHTFLQQHKCLHSCSILHSSHDLHKCVYTHTQCLVPNGQYLHISQHTHPTTYKVTLNTCVHMNVCMYMRVNVYQTCTKRRHLISCIRTVHFSIAHHVQGYGFRIGTVAAKEVHRHSENVIERLANFCSGACVCPCIQVCVCVCGEEGGREGRT